MVQGGDPTGTGKGGESIYGKHFEDEIHPALGHHGAGIVRSGKLSMRAGASHEYNCRHDHVITSVEWFQCVTLGVDT